MFGELEFKAPLPFLIVRLGMKLFLSKTRSANNVMGKELTSELELDINLRSGVDVLRPVLRLAGNGVVSGDELRNFNYARIPALGNRSYFVRGINSVNSKVWELELEVDVLETYATQLADCNARLWREVRTGDYYNADVDRGTRETVGKFMSDVTLDANAKTNILTVVSGGEE